MPHVTLLNERPRTIRRLSRNSKIFKSVVQAIREKKGERILSLDLREIPEAIADFFVICEAGSATQVKAITDFIEEYVKRETGELPYRQEGLAGLNWVLIDYVNIVIHIFQPETRRFYSLEEMWSDAGMAEHTS